MKTSKKILAVLLTIATIIGIFSCATTVFAEDLNEYADNKAYQENLLTEAVETEGEQSEIVCEVPEKRDEFSKTYKRADGSYTSVVSKTPIHKLENGEWEEINNTLETKNDTISNVDGAFDVEFPGTISENEQITVSNNGESIAFSVNGIENSTGVVEENETTETDLIKQDLEKVVSQITYENVDENTDIQYVVSSNYVKENIIVSNKESLKGTYSFDIEKGNLSAELDNKNNLIFKNDKNEVAFTIPAPVMTDADNAVSYDIDVSVENSDKSVLTLTYTPSKEWLENAKYPVIIDPVIMFESYDGLFIEDTVISYFSDLPESAVTNGYDNAFGFVADYETSQNGMTSAIKSEVLVKLNMGVFAGLNKPNIAVTDVNFIAEGGATNGNFLVKEINGVWDAETITYRDVYPIDETEPIITYNEKVLDYHTGGNSTLDEDTDGFIAFNISELFNEWLRGEKENNGFAITAGEGAAGTLYLDGYVQVTQNGNVNKIYYDTYVTVDYVDTSGGNDGFEYLSQEIGRAGSTNVNTFTRSLYLYRSDLSMDGLRMPVTVGFNYRPAIDSFLDLYVDLNNLSGSQIAKPEIYGKNWYPNLLMGIAEVTNNQYQVLTPDGTLLAFNEKIEEELDANGKPTGKTFTVIEEDEVGNRGYSLELINEEYSASITNLKLITPNGEVIYFYSNGFAKEICEEEPNSDGTYDKITITYDSRNYAKIDYVTDGIGRIYDFTYNSADLLSEINCFTADGTPIKAGTTNTDLKVTYGYDSNGRLTNVTYPDGEAVSYTYDSNGKLIKAQNIDGYNIQYTYDNSGKVTHIAEYAGTTAGNTIDLVQLSSRQVKVIDAFNGTETYQFGKDGRLHYTFDDKGNYLKSDYAPAKDENVYSSNDWSISSQNLLKNGSFETAAALRATRGKYWSSEFETTDLPEQQVVNEKIIGYDSATFGEKAYLISSTGDCTDFVSQTVEIATPGAYTFSAFVRSQTAGELTLKITGINGSNRIDKEASVKVNSTTGWERFSVTYKPSDNFIPREIKVSIGFEGKMGTYYVDCVQLEKGLGTAAYNLIENGTFNNSNEYWSDSTIVTDLLNGKSINAVKLSGGLPQYKVGDGLDRPADTLYLEEHVSATTQNVKINGKKGDTYSIGGWFKGKFDDNNVSSFVASEFPELTAPSANSTAQIKVTYSYIDTVTETDETTNETTTTQQTVTENFVVDFAPHNEDWQYAVDTFALKGDTESVDVTVMAKNVVWDCFATGISLKRDFESELVEDDEEETEDFNDVSEEICVCGCEDCYYGENCPCTGAINNECQCPECLRKETSTQDNFGNTLSNKSTDGINYLETFNSYTTDGNNLSSTTDENGNVITYNYDELNSVLKSVISPIGTESETTTTNYSYDAMGNVVSVSTTVSDNQNQALRYVYVKDRLTEIITPNEKYRIIYDDWGQVRSVNVVTGLGESENATPLVEYTYFGGVKRTQIETVTYKNSSTDIATYRYEYYDNGTLEKVYLNQQEIHNIECDNFGALESIENIGGRKVEYTDKGTFIYNPAGNCIYSTITNDDGIVTEENYGVTYKTFTPENEYDSATGISTETEKIEINSDNRIALETKSDYFGRTKSNITTVYDITEEVVEEKDANGNVIVQGVPAEIIGKIKTEYGYSVEEDGKTSSTIEKFINKTYNGDSESYRIYDGYLYEYDEQNKISAEKILNADGTTTDKYSYEYDKLGQLVRFNDAVANKTYTYTYDNNGNILTKSEYAYTLNDELGTATNITNFGYEAEWKDRLSTVGNQQIEYDNIGNPTSYLGATLTWHGRELKSYENDEMCITYEYDENGMRYRTTAVDKNSEENTTAIIDYVWLGEKLVSMVVTGDDSTNLSAKYLYNSSDEIIGFKWVNGSDDQATYYYLKNLQGDITGIVNSAGKLEMSFSYDVWGKVTTDFNVDSSSPLAALELLNKLFIGILNPFGYRGYCYDGYAGFYYLQSRYYDSNTGRFINADDTNYLNATGTVLGCNLFAYCENDAVNFVDNSGEVGTPIQWACAIIGGIIGVPFGKWLANKLGYTSGAKYVAIRAAAVVGGAALGWFSGSLLIRLVKAYITKNPQIMIKIVTRYGPKTLMRLRTIFGLNFTIIGPKVVAKIIVNAQRVGSALKNDLYHRAAAWLSESQLARGTLFRLSNGRILLQVSGTLNGKKGIFEYIIDELGRVCHEVFKAGGVINGEPN